MVAPLGEEEIIVGRGSQGTTVRLLERDVSRRHARFACTGGAIWVEDLGSSNGTRVNGERIEGRHRLREGDLVQVGGYDIAVLETAALPAAAGDTAPPEANGPPPSAGSRSAPAPPVPVPQEGPPLVPPAVEKRPARPPPPADPVPVSSPPREAPRDQVPGRMASLRGRRWLLAVAVAALLAGWAAGRFLRLRRQAPAPAAFQDLRR